MKILTSQIQRAPTSNPWRVQMLCGMISPKIRMMIVEETRPMAPVVRSAKRIDRALLIRVFPSSRVHSRRLPLFLTGRIVLACCLSSGSPPSTRICKESHIRSLTPEKGTERLSSDLWGWEARLLDPYPQPNIVE